MLNRHHISKILRQAGDCQKVLHLFYHTNVEACSGFIVPRMYKYIVLKHNCTAAIILSNLQSSENTMFFRLAAQYFHTGGTVFTCRYPTFVIVFGLCFLQIIFITYRKKLKWLFKTHQHASVWSKNVKPSQGTLPVCLYYYSNNVFLLGIFII